MEPTKYNIKKLINLIDTEINTYGIDPEKCIILDSYSDNEFSSITVNVTEKDCNIYLFVSEALLNVFKRCALFK